MATEVGQVPEPLLRPGPHQVALTFDDGPAGTYTEQILDILARYDVPATFFVVGGKAAARPDLLRRMAAEGHSVQNHTYSHAWLTRYSDAAIADQLTRASDVIEEVTGAAPACFRPPFGAVSDRVRRVAAGLGLATIMWDVDPWNFKRPGAGCGRLLGATGHRRRRCRPPPRHRGLEHHRRPAGHHRRPAGPRVTSSSPFAPSPASPPGRRLRAAPRSQPAAR